MLPGQVKAKVCFDKVRSKPRNVALLVGAGCSKSAGIPLASEITKEFSQLASERSPGINPDDYNAVVGELDPEERLTLFRGYADNARVNLAHLCIADLMRHSVVDRILTTNFDPLLIRACALADVFPAVYDCTAITKLTRVFGLEIPGIYYLHGQTYGLPMLNTDPEFKEYAAVTEEVVYRNIQLRTLIVAGYSGMYDRVIQQLQTIETLSSVFWVPYSERDATRALKAFAGKPHRKVLQCYDADEFFYDLLRELQKDPPVIAANSSSFAEQVKGRTYVPEWFPKTKAEREAAAEGRAPQIFTAVTPDNLNLLIEQHEAGIDGEQGV
jgi:hypothetical protein